MRLGEIWRYPVKSMAGERLDSAPLGPDGIAGDRVIQVRREGGAILDARRLPGLLAHRATWSEGAVLVDGRAWDSPEVARDVAAVAGPGAQLAWRREATRFDVLPLLVATDGALWSFGRDRRRLRPNLVIDGVEGLAERDWPGFGLSIGSALVGIRSLRSRCVMTTWDPDTQASDPSVLRDIVERFGGKLALDAWVIRAGTVSLGDPVRLVEITDVPSQNVYGRYADA